MYDDVLCLIDDGKSLFTAIASIGFATFGLIWRLCAARLVQAGTLPRLGEAPERSLGLIRDAARSTLTEPARQALVDWLTCALSTCARKMLDRVSLAASRVRQTRALGAHRAIFPCD